MHFLPPQSQLIPNWQPYTKEENKFFENLFVTKDEVVSVGKETTKQATCNKWKSLRENRITSINAHKIFIRKKNFESLFENELSKKEKKIPNFVQDALKHGHCYEPVVRRKYYEIMQYRMKRNIFLREAGLVIQLLLFWLGASPDVLIYDKEYSDHPGLLEIKRPSNRRNSSLADLLRDQSFYLQQNKNVEVLLKKDHHFGYYTQVQMAMGLSQVNYCDLVVFTFKCMIITRVEFDNEYFEKLILKLNKFYKIFMLPDILLQRQIKMKTST